MILSLLSAAVPGKTTPYLLEEALQKPLGLNWYIVPLFVILMYIITVEVKNKNYNVLFGAIAFWLWDVFNETWNAMVYATTGQPVWGTTAAGNSALQIMIGYNIEISFMFLILGMVACKFLKNSADYEGERFMDANKNWLSDPHNMYYKANVRRKDLSDDERKIKFKAVMGRMLVAIGGSIAAVIVEILLNACNVLTWEKSWWQPSMPIILFLIGYLPFFVAAFVVHDLPRKWQFVALGCILFVVILLLIIAGSMGMLGPQTDGLGNWVGKYYNPAA